MLLTKRKGCLIFSKGMSYGTISQENENEISQAETLPLQSNRSHLPGEGHLNLQPQNITLSLLPVWNFFKSLNFISQFFFFKSVNVKWYKVLQGKSHECRILVRNCFSEY